MTCPPDPCHAHRPTRVPMWIKALVLIRECVLHPLCALRAARECRQNMAMALYLLAQRGPSSMPDLREVMSQRVGRKLRKSAIQLALQTLILRGLVERDGHTETVTDDGDFRCRITDVGRAVARRAERWRS